MSANDPKRTLAGVQLFRSSATGIAGAPKSAFDLWSHSFLDPRLGLFGQARCHGLRVLSHVERVDLAPPYADDMDARVDVRIAIGQRRGRHPLGNDRRLPRG
jgi:hypothetical protein